MVIDISRSVLIAIDVQKDFCPGGALAVAGGDEVVGPINKLSARFAAAGGKVVATQDWHPRGHVSFASSHADAKPFDVVAVPVPDTRIAVDADAPVPAAVDQALWPDHCVQGTDGADFHAGFDLRPICLIVRKGSRAALDSYSAFFENDRATPTGLDGWLKGLGLRTLFLCGLATDFCVLYSALDAVRLGYQTIVFLDACRGVGAPDGSVERAIGLMRESGVHFMNSGDFR